MLRVGIGGHTEFSRVALDPVPTDHQHRLTHQQTVQLSNSQPGSLPQTHKTSILSPQSGVERTEREKKKKKHASFARSRLYQRRRNAAPCSRRTRRACTMYRVIVKSAAQNKIEKGFAAELLLRKARVTFTYMYCFPCIRVVSTLFFFLFFFFFSFSFSSSSFVQCCFTSRPY